LRGDLPWQYTQGRTKEEEYKRVMQMKVFTHVEDLCKGLPCKFVCLFVVELKTLVKYVRKLKFEEEPNYTSIQRLIEDVLARNNYVCDFIFDWDTQLKPQNKDMLSADEKQLNKIRKEIRYS
jgi:hypothetical protein